MAAPQAGQRLQAVRAILITSDEATIVFLRHVNESAHSAFIYKVLDSKNILVRADAVGYIREKLRDRVLETVFEEDEAAEQPQTAWP